MSQGRIKVIQMKFPRTRGSHGFSWRKGARGARDAPGCAAGAVCRSRGTDGQKDRQTNTIKGLTFRVGADENPDAAAGGHEVRRQGGEVPGESRPPERRVPGTGQLGARTGWPHRPWQK